MSKKRLYVFDIDGTIADLSHRLKYWEQEPKDWGKFFKECVNDKPIAHTIRLLDYIFKGDADNGILFLTGRSDECEVMTKKWLSWYTGYQPEIDAFLRMRKEGDHRHDTIVKKELLDRFIEAYPEYKVEIIFEDRTSVVDMWRENGYTCFQVAKGDF